MPCRRGAMPGAYSKRSKGRKKRVARKEEVPLDPLTAEFQKISDDFRNNNKVGGWLGDIILLCHETYRVGHFTGHIKIWPSSD